ncbi:WD repeat-containing protein 6, partial [Cryomyces antarcticus]
IFRYTFTSARKHWQLLLTGNYLTCCLTQSAYLLQPRHFVLATASTDGHLALWTLGAPLTHSRDAAAVVPRTAEWRVRLRIHQSTIKCMAEHILDANTWLLVTGGDDNALALTRIDSIDCEVERATLLVPSAHAAAVTALAVLSGPREPVQGRRRLTVVTSSNDQRIKVWAVSVDLNARGVDGIAVEMVDDIFTPVADVSSMEVMEDDGSGARVLVCGVGMDLWRLSR